ncbi:MAG: C25 family cysteine peptidase, partial [Pyrinomonadaceae bacterium]
ENDQVAALVPPSISRQFVNRSSGSLDAVRSQLMSGINQGPMIVNYSGHGTLDAWTGGGLFKNPDVYALSNSNHLPFFVTMTCLNGYFQDPQGECISEALLKAPNGGAIAVWSSSGLTVPFGQALMNKQLYQLLFSDNPPALGDAIKISKAATPDWDVRKTWVLFGDPSMHLR